MIVIEEMFYRRGGDVAIFGPQDVNIRSYLEPEKPADVANSNVEASEEVKENKGRTPNQRSKWFSLLFCCFPRKSARDTSEDGYVDQKAEPKQKSERRPGLLRRIFDRRSNGTDKKENRDRKEKRGGTFLRKLMRGSSVRADRIPKLEETAKPTEKKISVIFFDGRTAGQMKRRHSV